VGAYGEDSGSSPNAGRAYIISGADGSTLVQLSSPNEEEYVFFGWSVSGVGDVNGDTIPDVIVGAPHEGIGGHAYIFSGADGSTLVQLSSPNEKQFGTFGWSVSSAGDVNGDTIPDVIVGAYGEDSGSSPNEAGRAYIISGANGTTLVQLLSPNEEEFGRFGWSVSSAGDVNGDTIPDVIVGAPYEGIGGHAYIFSGANGSLLFELKSPNEEQYGSFGTSVSKAGDINGDGKADVIVGAPYENPGTSTVSDGRAYVFSGKDGSVLFELKSPNVEPLPGEAYGDFGVSVSDAGDVNMDGVPDMIVGAFDENDGHAYIVSGADGKVLTKLTSPHPEKYGGFGFSVSSAGDVNNDGRTDVIVGAPYENPGSSPYDAGRAYIFVSPEILPPDIIQIISNTTWKSYDRLQSGWEEVNFNDSHWRNAHAPYPHVLNNPPTYWIPDTKALYMWDWPNGSAPTGKNGPVDAWFRKTFTTSLDPSEIVDATAVIAVDDDFDFYVNGALVHSDWDGTVNTAPFTIDIKPYLNQGKNVLALYAKDAGSWEWALVDVKIDISVVEPIITVIFPNGGETWNPMTKNTIEWTSGGITGLVKIELSRNGGNTWTPIVKKTKNDGEYIWLVTKPTTDKALIRISNIDDPSVTDTSNSFFKIGSEGEIILEKPNGGEIWNVGTKNTIEWASSGIPGLVKIELSRDSDKTWKPIVKKTKNDGEYIWLVTKPTTDKALIRISSIDDPSVTDTSNNVFKIVPK
jgi:hypothetical protein